MEVLNVAACCCVTAVVCVVVLAIVLIVDKIGADDDCGNSDIDHWIDYDMVMMLVNIVLFDSTAVALDVLFRIAAV